MKHLFRILLLTLLVLNVAAVFAQKPQIVFDKLEHDFGTFKESDGVQTVTFKFTNKGSVPLVLSNVRASCGCTTPKWTKEPVVPGKTGEIHVGFNPQNQPGTFNKTIMVSSNAESGTTVLRITGRVEERDRTLAENYPRELGVLRARTNHISFARMTGNVVKTQELELVNDNVNPVKIEFRAVPGHLSVKAEPQVIPSKGKGKLLVTYDAGKVGTYGFVSHRIYLTLNGINDYKSSVGVSATIEEDFSALSEEDLKHAPVARFSETTYDFGELKQGDKKEYTFSLTNAGERELIIRNIRSSCGCTAVTPSKKVIGPGESAPIKVTFDSRGKRGRQSKSITVITNDPRKPVNTLRITCNITT